MAPSSRWWPPGFGDHAGVCAGWLQGSAPLGARHRLAPSRVFPSVAEDSPGSPDENAAISANPDGWTDFHAVEVDVRVGAPILDGMVWQCRAARFDSDELEPCQRNG
eukprot:2499039-Alexandrium_andersonii.AAC.1